MINMLTVSPTQSTIVTVTLQENTVYQPNYYYTWSITNKGTNQNIVFYQTDSSTNPFFYNQFEIIPATSSAAIGLTNGSIPLFPGEWIYQIYQMSDPYDLNLSNALIKVENGLLIVPSTTTFSSIPGYTYPNNFVIPGPNYNPLL